MTRAVSNWFTVAVSIQTDLLLVPLWSRSWQRQAMRRPRQLTGPKPDHQPVFTRHENII